MKHLRKLMQIGSAALAPTSASFPARILALAGPMADQLEYLIAERNGFFAFESSLHVLPLAPALRECELGSWNDPDLWKNAYGEMAPTGICFAEDAFGNQFFLGGNGISSFDAETAEIKQISENLDDWAKAILDDYPLLTGFPLAHEWQATNGMLPLGFRLLPIQPFVIGGAYRPDNLRAVAAGRGMRWRGELASQIRNLPDGTSVRLKMLD